MASNPEITAVQAILDKEWPNGTISEDVAKAAIKALDALRGTTWRPIGPPIRQGQAFKSIITKDTHYVAWVGEDAGREMAWIVTSDSDYGFYAPTLSPFWKWTEPVPEKKGTNRTVQEKQKDEFGAYILDDDGEIVTKAVKKYYPPVHETIFENEIGMQVGDRIKLRQYNRFEVIATHKGGVLMKERDTGEIFPEKNETIKHYYQDGWE